MTSHDRLSGRHRHLHRQDGRSYVVTGILNDPDNPLDLVAGTQLITNAITLI